MLHFKLLGLCDDRTGGTLLPLLLLAVTLINLRRLRQTPSQLLGVRSQAGVAGYDECIDGALPVAQ